MPCKTLIDWFKPRFVYYGVFIVGYLAFFILTGWDIYPHQPYLWHSLYHFFFSILFLFLYSFYVIRLLLYGHKYALLILSVIIFILINWFIAYFIYPQAGEERINLPFFITNRFIFFLVPVIIEILIQNREIRKKYDHIQLVEQILQLNQQINPHLLFNTLTTLHHQILIKSPKAEYLSIKLSNLMEYSLKLSTNIWVTLESEINFLNSYLEVEKIGLEKNQNIFFYTQCLNIKNQIPAMLLIVFLENAFKHSDIKVNSDGLIEAILVQEENQIFFQIKNSKSIENDFTKKNRNIGLKNIRKRLNIMFPKQHELEIIDLATSYQINLKLNILNSTVP